MAKLSAVFYVESQLLVNYRICNQYSDKQKVEVKSTQDTIKNELISNLTEQSESSKNILKATEIQLRKLQKKELINNTDISKFFYALFYKNKNTLIRYK